MFFRVLLTECLKLKRTLALWMVLVTPLVMVLLQFAITAKRANALMVSGIDAWPPMVKQTIEVWTLLMMPMFVTLETSLLAGLENTGKNWKSLLALPAPRWTIYASKLVVTISLLWAAHAVLVAGTIGSGWILKLIHPNLNLGSMPLDPFVAPMLRVSVSALLAVAIQHWVSLRWQSYSVAIGFGMVRHADRYFRGAIKRNRTLVSLVSADQSGIEWRGRPGSNHSCRGCRRNLGSHSRLLGVCEARNRVRGYSRSVLASITAQSRKDTNAKTPRIQSFKLNTNLFDLKGHESSASLRLGALRKLNAVNSDHAFADAAFFCFSCCIHCRITAMFPGARRSCQAS